MSERQILYWLCQNPDLGAASISNMYEYFENYETLYFNIEESRLENVPGLSKKMIGSLIQWKEEWERCEAEYNSLEEKKLSFITHLDLEYPERLKNIYRYPMALMIKGELPKDDEPSIAIVGARGCSAYGEQLAYEFGRALGGHGVQIISGLALGIDGAAHKGALSGNYPTFGVLGCGVNVCYPSANYRYYEEMSTCGGVISEFPLGMKPVSRNFPMRNRIISGLSDAILVVEAKERSGSLITAELGLEQGREIFAIPGRITDYLSNGCNRLIQQGAHVAISPDDILEYLHVTCDKKLTISEKNLNGLAKTEKMVYSCLDFKPKHLEDITTACGLPVSECMTVLMELELGGFVYRSANHYYGKKIDI